VARNAVGVGCGTDAITLALRALGIGPGDEVVTAANTCVPTLTGIIAAGAAPVLVDVDPHTYTLDPDLLDDVLTQRTRAIVPVHLYGHCAGMERIVAFARDHDLKVVEDAAHAHGRSMRAGEPAVSRMPQRSASTRRRTFGALGDGGAVVTDDATLAARLAQLRSHGEDASGRGVLVGCCSRLDELQAAMLQVKLERLDAGNERRRALASFYAQALRDTPLELPTTAAQCRHAYHLFVVRSADREGLRSRLAAAGVETLVHYPWALPAPGIRSPRAPRPARRASRSASVWPTRF